MVLPSQQFFFCPKTLYKSRSEMPVLSAVACTVATTSNQPKQDAKPKTQLSTTSNRR
jgi:hypothetical protein